MYAKERTAVSSVTKEHLRDAQWLLSIDALQHYSAPYYIVNFNYAKFAGDYRKMDPVSGLSYLDFESDMARQEEKLLLSGQQLSSDVIREGFLVVMPGDSIVDNFRVIF